jgi:hypothetical protein
MGIIILWRVTARRLLTMAVTLRLSLPIQERENKSQGVGGVLVKKLTHIETVYETKISPLIWKSIDAYFVTNVE